MPRRKTKKPSYTPYRDTVVPAARSQAQINAMLEKAGATAIQWSRSPGRGAALRCLREGVSYRIPVRFRTPDKQGERQAMRWIFFFLKALLEKGLFLPFEQTFLAFVELEGSEGPTMGQWLIPQLPHLENKPLLPGVEAVEVVEGKFLPLPEEPQS